MTSFGNIESGPTVMTEEEVRTQVETWYDAFVVENS
jgi:hypothetical protein